MASSFRHRTRVLMLLPRFIIWVMLWLIALIMIVMGAALSPWGTAWLFDQAESRGLLSVGSVEGAPLDHLVLTDLHVDIAALTLDADRFELAWADDCLLKGRLCIDRLGGNGIRVNLKDSAEKSAPDADTDQENGLPHIATPIPVEVRAIEFSDFALTLADGTYAGWTSFTSGLRFEGDTLTLADTHWQSPRVALPVTSENVTAADLQAPVDVALVADVAGVDASATTADKTSDVLQELNTRLLEEQTFDVNRDVANEVVSGQPAVNDITGDATENVADQSSPNPLAAFSENAQGDRLDLPDISLPINVDIPSFIIDDFQLSGPTPYTINRFELSLHGHDNQVEITRIFADTPDATATLSGAATLADEYPLQLAVNATMHRAPVDGEKVALTIEGSLADLTIAMTAQGPVDASLDASLDALDRQLPFNAALKTPLLGWPLQGTPDYRVRDFSLTAEGSLAGYRIDLATQASGAQFADTRITLAGQGDFQQFAWQPLRLETAQGRLESQGSVRWAPALDAHVLLTMSDLRLQDFVPDITGRLNGEAALNFHQQDQAWSLEVPNVAINGTLQQRPLSLQAKLNGNSEMQWHIDTLDLRQGRNRITAQGDVAKKLSLDANIQAPALGTILPDLGGSLTGQVRLAGTMQKPQGHIVLDGEAIRYGENRLGSLSLRADASGLNDPQFDIEVNAQHLVAGGQNLRALALTLEGRLSSHHLALAIDSAQDMPVTEANLALDGGLNLSTQRYSGQLSPLNVETVQAGTIVLDDPMRFNVNLANSSATIEPFCLVRRQGGRLCATQAIAASADQGHAQLSITDLPMTILNDYLPDQWHVTTGQTDGNITAQWSRGGANWQANGQVNSQLEVTTVDAQGQTLQLPATSLGLTFSATPAQANADLALDLDGAGNIKLNASVDDPMGQRGLNGRLRVDHVNFAPYRRLVSDLSELEGQMNGDIRLDGDLEQPRLNGSLVIDGVKASGEQLPVMLDDARLALEFQGAEGTLNGYLASNQARWQIKGEAGWPTTGDWRAHAALNGGRSPLEVILPGMGRLRVAPHLDVAATPSRLNITGNVRIPWARLAIDQIPASAEAPSSDEVILTREEAAELDKKIEQAKEDYRNGKQPQWADMRALEDAGMELNVNVDIIVGNDVQLEAYGLQSQLEGRMNVRQQAGSLQLFGDVSLVNGRFSAFGQNLIIQEGKVSFNGPPSMPYLQFRAIRNPDTIEDDVTAGLQVSGSAQNPQIEVFSDPEMNDTRALSYLLRGRAPDSESEGGNDNALTSALIGLSLSRSGRAVGQLGESFGVEDLSLDTSGSGDESQVVVSGYLFENLKVSYGVGLFSSIAELTLRYRLLQNLYVQAVSGANQAVDLLYTFSLGRSHRPRPAREQHRSNAEDN
ncbi:autotransporter assembly complex protein TamB [Phytohalomonas tamaricis]|uniref:autotransporter assembly complex protein TamB n=1 Tax=Phytohalomonas tamaricis TaxID=2081032 RepID=UPI000D0B3268|nr:translocation/assembly module TamB domain-containing protein [Phytohalomonas tamaricis]